MTWRSLILRVLLCFSLLLSLSASLGANKKKPPVKPVNINTATSEELQQVPGIGPATAQKILQMRKSGLGEKRLDKMRKYLTVGKPSPSKSANPSGQTAPQPTSSPKSDGCQFATREIRLNAVSQILPPLYGPSPSASSCGSSNQIQ